MRVQILKTIQFNSTFLYIISTDIDCNFVNFIKHCLKALHLFCDVWNMKNFAHKPCRHACNQIPWKIAHTSLIIAIKSEVKISTFHKGKITQTEDLHFSKIQNHTKCQDPKLLLPPQKIVQEPCLIARNVWCNIQWHDIYTSSTEVKAECKLTTVQPYVSWPRNPV